MDSYKRGVQGSWFKSSGFRGIGNCCALKYACNKDTLRQTIPYFISPPLAGGDAPAMRDARRVGRVSRLRLKASARQAGFGCQEKPSAVGGLRFEVQGKNLRF